MPMFADSKVLWTANQQLSDLEKQFRFTYFSLSLNEMTVEQTRLLPPTDSRRRQDMKVRPFSFLQGNLNWGKAFTVLSAIQGLKIDCYTQSVLSSFFKPNLLPL